jgi:hypothetical protein
MTRMVPLRKVENDRGGQCDNCGDDLGNWKWRLGESTGCCRECAILDYKRDLTETPDEQQEQHA